MRSLSGSGSGGGGGINCNTNKSSDSGRGSGAGSSHGGVADSPISSPDVTGKVARNYSNIGLQQSTGDQVGPVGPNLSLT